MSLDLGLDLDVEDGEIDVDCDPSDDFTGSPEDFVEDVDLNIGTDFAKSFLHDAESAGSVQPILSLPVIQTDFDTGLPFQASSMGFERHGSVSSSELNFDSAFHQTSQTQSTTDTAMLDVQSNARYSHYGGHNHNRAHRQSHTHLHSHHKHSSSHSHSGHTTSDNGQRITNNYKAHPDNRTSPHSFYQMQGEPTSIPPHSSHMSHSHPTLPTNFARELESNVLHGISVAEATRLIQVWDYEVNVLYPLFPVGELQRKFAEMCQFYSQHGVFRAEDEYELLNVKITIAIGSVTAESHMSAGIQLYDEMLSKVERNLISGKASLASLITLLLMHQYQFHRDMGTIAYRTVGLAGILALELGLYSAQDTERLYKDPSDREYARVVFWSLYVMDRRLAIYAKRPFVLHDEDIDQKLPQFDLITTSEDDLFRAMHLNYMIHYSRLVGKVLETLGPQRNSKGFQDNVQYLIFLMEKWQSSLPSELKLRDNLPSQPSPDSSRKLKWIIFLKSNLIMLHIYQSCTQEAYIQPAINTSCECIRELGRLYFNTDFYASCEIQYNHFLVAALDVLYSSLRRAPQFLSKCTPEIKLALKIISLIMKRSHNDRRNGTIWQLVVSFAFKFGLSSPLGAKLLQAQEIDVSGAPSEESSSSPTHLASAAEQQSSSKQHDYMGRELLLTTLISELGEST